MTVLLVEQNALMALAVAHRGYVLETGRVILADSAAHLRKTRRSSRRISASSREAATSGRWIALPLLVALLVLWGGFVLRPARATWLPTVPWRSVRKRLSRIWSP